MLETPDRPLVVPDLVGMHLFRIVLLASQTRKVASSPAVARERRRHRLGPG
jgi:hypothetical protein